MLARLRQDAGNIATDTRSGSVYTYGHNARGRLATVHQDGNLKGTYSYNSLEQLAARTVTNSGPFDGTAHTTQDRSGNILAEADGTTGVVSREYIWLPGAGYAGTDLPVGVVDVAGTATPELLYVHADHLSRPIRLTDAAKVTAWAVEWLPWGGVHSITGSETLNARFPGQWFQVESGLHYNWHRHYDPTIGRYTQPDPLGFIDGPSVFAYAKNAPGEVIDPTGLFGPMNPDRSGFAPPQSKSSASNQCKPLVELVNDPCKGGLSNRLSPLAGGDFVSPCGSGGGGSSRSNRSPSDFITDSKGNTTDVRSTLDRIQWGEGNSHRNDGTVFNNREGLLPQQQQGYYREYVVPTPGATGPGPMRIIQGQGGEIYFTPNHYKTFIPIK